MSPLGFSRVFHRKVVGRAIKSTGDKTRRELSSALVCVACSWAEKILYQTLAPSTSTLLLTMGSTARQLRKTAVNLRRATDQVVASIASSPKASQLEASA
ncbi:hypothetical protein EDD85DRAFT_959140 [Armillaria nabsnona]|nr:hypothetical protein EDD85DRAFT_959140 [Armillaria nabsnona]